MLIKDPPPAIKGYALTPIGPDQFEIDLPAELGYRPTATQKGDAFASQPCAVNDGFLLRV